MLDKSDAGDQAPGPAQGWFLLKKEREGGFLVLLKVGSC